MAKKKATPTKVQRVKAVARDRVGVPKPARVLKERATRAQPKYKKKLSEADD